MTELEIGKDRIETSQWHPSFTAEDSSGKDMKAVEEKSRENHREKIFTEIGNDLNRAVIQFSIDHNGKKPSKLEAEGIVGSLLKILKERVFIQDASFLNKKASEGGLYNTGRVIRIDIPEEGKANFQLVLDPSTGKFELNGEIKGGILTTEGELAEQLRFNN